MFEIDWARGFVYKGKKGWIIKTDPKGVYIRYRLKKLFLTEKNSKVLGG